MNIITDIEFDNRHRKHSDTEYDQLKSSLKDVGLKHPILIWEEEGIIIDGHHRYRACLELNIKPRYIFKSFCTRERALLEADRSQASMRNLSSKEYAILLLRIRDYEQTSLKKVPGGTFSDKKPQTLKDISDESNASERTVKRLKKVVDSGNESVIDKVVSGELTPTEAEREVTGKSKPVQKKRCSGPAPEIFEKKIGKENDTICDSDDNSDIKKQISEKVNDLVTPTPEAKKDLESKGIELYKVDLESHKSVIPVPRDGYEIKECVHCNGIGYIEVKKPVANECPLYGKHSLNKWGTCPCGYCVEDE